MAGFSCWRHIGSSDDVHSPGLYIFVLGNEMRTTALEHEVTGKPGRPFVAEQIISHKPRSYPNGHTEILVDR